MNTLEVEGAVHCESTDERTLQLLLFLRWLLDLILDKLIGDDTTSGDAQVTRLLV